jgi:hypothetical protein
MATVTSSVARKRAKAAKNARHAQQISCSTGREFGDRRRRHSILFGGSRSPLLGGLIAALGGGGELMAPGSLPNDGKVIADKRSWACQIAPCHCIDTT